MRVRSRTRLRAGVASAALVVLAGCGSSEQQSNVSPLNELWGPQLSQAEQRAQQLKQEEAIAACMQEEGWEYTPVDYSAQMPDVAEEVDPNSPDYGEKYGYGIVYGYRTWELPNLDEDGNYIDSGMAMEDPNSDYTMSLSPDEQNEYYISLSGDWSKFQEPSLDDAGNEIWESPPLEDQGCQGQAQLEVYGEQPWNNQDYNDRMNELFEALESDPAIEDAEITWSDCMYDLNTDYDFYGPNDAWMLIDTEMNEAKGLEQMPVDPDTGMVIGGDGNEMVYMTTVTDDGEGIGWVGQPKRLTEEQLDTIEVHELELWKADQSCQDETDLREIRRSREQEIVDTIHEEFPQYTDSQAGGVG